MLNKLILSTALLLIPASGCLRPEKKNDTQTTIPSPDEVTTTTTTDTKISQEAKTTTATALKFPAASEEQAVLKNLEPFRAKFELDAQSRVERVVLEGPQVTDKALDEVVKLPHLKRLSLAKSSVTDAGMLKLQDLVYLTNLGITDTPVTDQGLKHLEKIPSLRNVWVCENDKVTKKGIAALRQALIGINVQVMNQTAKKQSGDKKK